MLSNLLGYGRHLLNSCIIFVVVVIFVLLIITQRNLLPCLYNSINWLDITYWLSHKEVYTKKLQQQKFTKFTNVNAFEMSQIFAEDDAYRAKFSANLLSPYSSKYNVNLKMKCKSKYFVSRERILKPN
jgi:hypothetical protein